jgi:N-formylglutamate amidohydrolase
MTPSFCRVQVGDSPLVAVAVHDGHDARDDSAALFAISDAERLREEDPFTGLWAEIAETHIIGLHSRFEVDLNRPRDKAVYINPEDAWGLTVWKSPPPPEMVETSLAQYDAFYAEVEQILRRVADRYGRFVVFDLHTYNHRRDGADGPPADPAGNPEVNIGTGTLDRSKWGALADRFMADLGTFDYAGRHLDVHGRCSAIHIHTVTQTTYTRHIWRWN